MRTAPVEHLGQRTLRALRAFLLGFNFARQAYKKGMTPPDALTRERFYAWLAPRLPMTDEYRSRLNALSCLSPESYAQLMSDDDAAAFDFYLGLRRSIVSDTDEAPNVRAGVLPSTSIVEELRILVLRPAMYLGNDCSTHELFAFCNGFLYCEAEIGIGESENHRLLNGFADWLAKRYPFAAGRPWGHTFHFLALSSGKTAIAMFSEHWDMYLSGDSPTVADRTQQQMLENIKRRLRDSAG